MKCPCHSNKSYQECCKPFHDGRVFPNTPLELMRSRYAAYALKKFDYINETATKKSDPEKMRTNFQNMQFLGLEILAFSDTSVTFHAALQQNGKDCSFTEESHFIQLNGRWLYESK